MSTDTTNTEVEENAEAEAPQKLTLEVKVDKKGACERHVTVTIARDDIERYFREAFDKLAPRAEVPGFRAGRAPCAGCLARALPRRARDARAAVAVDGALLLRQRA